MTGRDIWTSNLDERGNIIALEKKRRELYNKKEIEEADEPVHESKLPEHSETNQVPYNAPTPSRQVSEAPNQPVFSFQRPTEFEQPIENTSFKISQQPAQVVNPLSNVPNAQPLSYETTFEPNKAPWSPKQHQDIKPSNQFRSIRAPVGPSVAGKTRLNLGSVGSSSAASFNFEVKPSQPTQSTPWAPQPVYKQIQTVQAPSQNNMNQYTESSNLKPWEQQAKSKWTPSNSGLSDSTDYVKSDSGPQFSTTSFSNFNHPAKTFPMGSHSKQTVQAEEPKPVKNKAQNLVYQPPSEKEIQKTAIQSSSVLDIMKMGASEVLSESQQKIKAEEEKKRQQSAGRYAMYMDYIDDVETGADSEPTMDKFNALEARIQKNSKFENPNSKLDDQYTFEENLNIPPPPPMVQPMKTINNQPPPVNNVKPVHGYNLGCSGKPILRH